MTRAPDEEPTPSQLRPSHRVGADGPATSRCASAVAGLPDRADRSTAAAAGKNVLAYRPDIARQLLRADLLDEISLHLVPILLGGGRRAGLVAIWRNSRELFARRAVRQRGGAAARSWRRARRR